jgi:coronin-1B/1C/6
MSRFAGVRQSSFRHVFGTPAKADHQFQFSGGVKPALSGDGNFIAGNTKYFALPLAGGGGPVWVNSLTKVGRCPAKVPVIAVHKSAVLDVAFHPFIDTLLGTAGDEGLVKITKFPDGGPTEDIKEPVVTLEGHSKKVVLLQWNPVANNILATVSADNTARIWDIEAQAEVLNWDISESAQAGDSLMHVEWNHNGSLAVSTSKDKKIRLWDPRDAKAAITTNGFTGTKKSCVLFADNHGHLIGVGSNVRAARQYAVWDHRNMEKPLTQTDIDQSAGVFVAHYDPDNSILYLAGKGDAKIMYYEVVKEAPYIHALTQFGDNESQQGACFLPKRACDVTKCEIAMCLRLMKESVVPISFQVPRKSDLFQKDLFPDTYAGVPSLEAKEWLEGKNAEPKLQSMKPGAAAAAPVAHQSSLKVKKSPAELEAEVERLTARVKDLEAQLAAKS